MVNCKNCGAPLSLEEAVCPHCGTPNPEAQEHLKKLAQLNSAFEQTQYEVVDEVKNTFRPEEAEAEDFEQTVSEDEEPKE